MAGHSKWANIKFRKAAQDKKRGKIFTKLIREITVAARTSGGEPEHNPRLRTAIDKALTANMTRDAIDRAIKRGAGGEDTSNWEEIVYEGHGPSSVAVMVFCLSDNRNRTVGDVRHAFTKFDGRLGTNGSVSYLFKKIGQIILAPDENKKYTEDQILDLVIDAGAEDVLSDPDGSIEIITAPDQESLDKVVSILKKNNIKPDSAEIIYQADTRVEVSGETAKIYTKFLDMLEDLDDVQEVYTNADLRD